MRSACAARYRLCHPPLERLVQVTHCELGRDLYVDTGPMRHVTHGVANRRNASQMRAEDAVILAQWRYHV